VTLAARLQVNCTYANEVRAIKPCATEAGIDLGDIDLRLIGTSIDGVPG
jgi:hypothetical protein